MPSASVHPSSLLKIPRPVLHLKEIQFSVPPLSHSYMLCPPLREASPLPWRIWGFPSQKGDNTKGSLWHTPATCPHGNGALLVLLSCFPSQARGENLNPFSKKQQLNLIQVCHFSAKRPASQLLKGWTNSCWFGLISSRVWKHCWAAISPPVASSTCLQAPSLVLDYYSSLCSGLHCWAVSKPTLSTLGPRGSWVFDTGFCTLLEVLMPGGWAVSDQIKTTSSQADFYFTSQWTEEHLGFSCE